MKFYSILSKHILFSLCLLPISVLAIEVETYRGVVSVDIQPKKIAVFDIAAIDTLNALEIKIDAVPNHLYLEHLREQFNTAEEVGSLFEPDLEALNAIEPDLVIVGGRSSDQLKQVKKVAPAIDMTIWGDDLLGQVKSRITAYGKIFNKTEQAHRLIAQLDEKLAAAKAAIENQGTALIVMTNGPKISVYGAQSRFGWLHKDLALPEAITSTQVGNHGEVVSFEFIAKANPDWLLVLDRAAAIGSSEQNARATLDNAVVQKTNAWQNNRVIYLPSAEVYIAAGGAHSTLHALDTIIDAFQNK